MIEWTPDAFKKELMATVEANAEESGAFIEADARRRLKAIEQPEWGAKYRRGKLAALMRHEVEQKDNEVELRVGLEATGGSKHHGFYIETGSSTAPAQPFLRPAVFQNGPAIVALLSGSQRRK
jgi:hypothetical protein